MKTVFFIIITILFFGINSCSNQKNEDPEPSTTDSMMVRFWNLEDGKPGDSLWLKNSLKPNERIETNPNGLGFVALEWTIKGAKIDYYQIGIDSIQIYRVKIKPNNTSILIRTIKPPPTSGSIQL